MLIIGLSAAVAIVMIVYSVCMFAKKGPLPVVHYFLLDAPERQLVRTPHEYKNAGVWLLLIGLVIAGYAALLAAGFYGVTKYGIALLGLAVLYFVCYDLKPNKADSGDDESDQHDLSQYDTII